MKQEIKDRVEKIRNGEVPEGYKRIQIGIVPKTWEHSSVEELARLSIIERPMDGNHGALHPTAEDYVGYGIPFIMANDISDGKVELKKCKFIRKEQSDKLQKGFAFQGDVLLTHKGSVGNTAIVQDIKTDYIMLTPQVTYYRIRDNEKIDKHYLLYYFQGDHFQNQLCIMSKGATRDYIGILAQKKLVIIFPSIHEQRKIASILTRWDEKISLKEQMIEGKKAQRRSFAFNLLTGRIRINEVNRIQSEDIQSRILQIREGKVVNGYKHSRLGIVPEEWNVVHLRDKFDRVTRKNAINNTNVLTISAQHGLISQEEFFKKSIASKDTTNYFLLKRGDFAYNKSYSNGYPYGAIKVLDKYDEGIVSPLYICFSPNADNNCPDFYKYYFEEGCLNHEIHTIAQEGARNHGLLNVSVEDFFNLYVVDFRNEEMRNITKFLELLSKEIELLEQELEALREQKKGLMQLLLTGIVRVKV